MNFRNKIGANGQTISKQIQYLILICNIMVILAGSSLLFGMNACNSNKPINTSSMTYDDYTELWKQFDKIQADGRFQDAIVKLDEIEEKALAEKNQEQLLKCITKRYPTRQRIEEDPIINQIKYVENLQSNLDPIATAVSQSYLAELYNLYYQRNQFRINQLTDVQGTNDTELKQWTARQLIDKIGALYLNSVEDKNILNVDIHSYNAIISLLDKDEGTQLRSTIYDLLAHRTVDYFSNSYSTLTQPSYQFLFNQEEAFMASEVFRNYTFQSKDSSSMILRATNIFQDLEQVHRASEEAVLIDILLKRLRFSYTKNNNDQKDALYLGAMELLYEKYDSEEYSINILRELVQYHLNKAATYNYPDKVVYKDSYKTAMTLLEKAESKYKDPRNQNIIKYFQEQILQDNLELRVEEVNPIDQDFLMFVRFKNISSVKAKIYRLSEKDLISHYEDSNKPERFWKSANLERELDFELPKMDDYQFHSIELPIRGLENGAYFMVLTGDKKSNSVSSLLHISDIAFTTSNNQTIQLMDRSSGLSKVCDITRYKMNWSGRKRDITQSGTGETDPSGMYKMVLADRGEIYRFQSENDVLFLNNYLSSYHQNGPNKLVEQITAFTDRSIYRPGQKVYFKAIAISQAVGKDPEIVASTDINVVLYDANYQEVEKLTLKTNDFGSINGSFELPTNLLNGNFNIQFEMRNRQVRSTSNFRVEEYKRPKFQIEPDPITAIYRLDEEVLVSGHAKSFAGTAIDNAIVRYKITRSQPYRYYYRYYYPSPEKMIAIGETTTDLSGKYEISFLAESDQSVKKSSNPVFNYTIEVNITDATGETRTEITNIQAGTKAYLLQIQNELILEETAKKSIKFQLTNQNGDDAKAKVQVKISELSGLLENYKSRYWPVPEFQYLSKGLFGKEFMFFAYSDEDKLDKRAVVAERKSYSIDVDGSGVLDLEELSPAIYKVEISHGDAVTATCYVTILDSETSARQIDILATMDSTSYEVGEIAKLRLFAGFKEFNYFVDILRTTGREDRKQYSKDNSTIDIPIAKPDRGGLLVKVSGVKNNRFYEKDVRITVPYTDKKLKLNWESFRSDLYPGSQEKWRLKITDDKQLPVVAEIVSSMYDASLDEFTPHQWRQFSFNGLRSYFNISPYGFSAKYGSNSRRHKGSSNPFYRIQYPFIQTYLNTHGGIALRGSRSKRSNRMDDMEMDAMSMEAPTATGAPPPAPAAKEAFESVQVLDENKVVTESSSQGAEPKASQVSKAPIRKNLNETVFFFPHLKTNAEGETFVEFTMNEALTEWKMQTFAHTKKAQFVKDVQTVKTSKDLMVFPNGPRFFRQGDEMEILTKVQNKTKSAFMAKAEIKFLDAFTMQDVTSKILVDKKEKTVSIPASGNASVSWKIKVPEGLESVSYQIYASSGDHQDGEENTSIVLTNRKLVTESLAIRVPGNSNKAVSFDALDKINNSTTLDPQLMKVSVTSNPSWLAVQSLPYLMEYQYNCSEQIFSRYFANQLGGYILKQNPIIEEVYQEWKSKGQLISALHKNEELKSVILQQSPWVMDALSEEEQMQRMATLFDMARLKTEAASDIKTLQQRQSSGGFPWFPGGRPNWYITQYILEGFGQLDKMEVINIADPNIQQMTNQAWKFVDQEVIEYVRRSDKMLNLSPLLIHYLYTRSFYPELQTSKKTASIIEDFEKLAKAKWLDHNILSQGQLALYFSRKADNEWASKIMESLRQRTIYKEDLGRYWKETNGYNWYQSNIETQALLIAAFDEISKNDDEVDELKQWLLSNKQTNRWKSTKATTQAVYALIERGEKWISNDKIVTFKVASSSQNIPEDKLVRATGQYDVVFAKEELNSSLKSLEFENKNSHTAWASSSFQYWEDLDKIENYQETPLKLKRAYFKKITSDSGDKLIPLTGDVKLETGDMLTVRLSLIVDRPMEFIHIQDLRAAGTEPIDVLSGYKWMSGLGYYMETRDAETNFFVDYLPRGEYTFEYNQRAVQPGYYSAGISTIQSMYAPEFGAHSEGLKLTIE